MLGRGPFSGTVSAEYETARQTEIHQPIPQRYPAGTAVRYQAMREEKPGTDIAYGGIRVCAW
eukprot:2498218-Rhodomonas_salina.1